jgi:type II secretory pathway pseudopilin PulG
MNDRGFSLLETIVALATASLALLALAEVVAVAVRAADRAGARSLAAVLAEDKMEQLRALAWRYDAAGLPESDTTTDLTTAPERAAGGRGLTPSPPGALQDNVDGYCDFLDARGASLGGGSIAPPGTAYVRRWSIEPLPGKPDRVLVLQVLVTSGRHRGYAIGGRTRLPDEAWLIGVRRRR